MTQTYDPDELPFYAEGERADVNFFYDESRGYHWHVKLQPLAGMPAEAIRAAVTSALDVVAEFQRQLREGPESPQEAAEPSHQTEPTQAPMLDPARVSCGICGKTGAWDNRDSKRNQKAPDLRCKACKAAAWIQSDGGLKWSAPL